MKKPINPPQITFASERLGMLLRSARENLGYSLRGLSKVCGISATHLMRMEAAKGDYSTEKLFRLCLTLGLPLGAVFDFAVDWRLEISVSVVDEAVAVDKPLSNLISKRGQKEERLRKRALFRFIFWNQSLATRLLLESSPETILSQTTFPLNGMASLWTPYSITAPLLSNVERVEAIRGLTLDPYFKLKGLGLITLPLIAAALEFGDFPPFECKALPSISGTLRYKSDRQ